jgi:hypothetical protein
MQDHFEDDGDLGDVEQGRLSVAAIYRRRVAERLRRARLQAERQRRAWIATPTRPLREVE